MVCGSDNCPVTLGFDSMINCCYEICHQAQWIGDKICDDDNNYETCGWDGGDCCGGNVNDEYCTLCECLDPNYA